MGNKKLFYSLLIVCLCTYLFVNNPHQFGFSKTQNEWYYHLMYNFVHVNILHLALNMMALYFIDSPFRKYQSWYVITVAFLSSLAASYLSVKSLPTIGLSGFLWALIGISYWYALCANFKQMFISFGWLTLAAIIIHITKSSFNDELHAFAYLFAFAFVAIVDGFTLLINKLSPKKQSI